MKQLSNNEFRSLFAPYASFKPASVEITYEPATGPSISLDAYREQMASRRLECINSTGISLDRGPTGVGKSAADQQLFRTGVRALSIQPTHENCAEVVEALRAIGVDAAAYPKRSTGGENPTCWNFEADDAEKLGLPVQQAVCFRCPQKAQCEDVGFLGRFYRATQAQVAVATAERAMLTGLERLSENRPVITLHEDVLSILQPQIAIAAYLFERAAIVLKRILSDPKWLDQFGTAYVAQAATGERQVDHERTTRNRERRRFIQFLLEICDHLLKVAAACFSPSPIRVPDPQVIPSGIHDLLFRACRAYGIQFDNRPVWRALIAIAAGQYEKHGVLINDRKLSVNESDDYGSDYLFDT